MPLLSGYFYHQLFVYPDPSYPKLLPLLGKEESIKYVHSVCLLLLTRFINRLLHFFKSSDPLANETHYFPPDPSREHRTQVSVYYMQTIHLSH